MLRFYFSKGFPLLFPPLHGYYLSDLVLKGQNAEPASVLLLEAGLTIFELFLRTGRDLCDPYSPQVIIYL